MSDLRETVRACVRDLARGDVGAAPSVVARLKEAGAVRSVHVGRKDLNPTETVEWYAGQIVDTLESGAWFAVNSIINCLDKFCPEQP